MPDRRLPRTFPARLPLPVLFATVLQSLTGGCGRNAGSAATAPPQMSAPYSLGLTDHARSVAGAARQYRVHVPAILNGTPRAVVFVLHGGGGAGMDVANAGAHQRRIARLVGVHGRRIQRGDDGARLRHGASGARGGERPHGDPAPGYRVRRGGVGVLCGAVAVSAARRTWGGADLACSPHDGGNAGDLRLAFNPSTITPIQLYEYRMADQPVPHGPVDGGAARHCLRRIR